MASASASQQQQQQPRNQRDLPISFDTVEQVVACIKGYPERQRFSRLADLMMPVPQPNPQLFAFAAELLKASKRNVSLYRHLCGLAGAPVDEQWCTQQETKNNADVLAIEKEIGRAGNNMDRDGQVRELAKRIEFASDIGNVQDIHRFAQKQQGYCNTAELAVPAYLQAFDALLFTATWEERDTPSYHSVAQQASRADSTAFKAFMRYKTDKEGKVDMSQLLTTGAEYDMFMEARAACVLGRCLSGDIDAAVDLLQMWPVRPDKAQVGKLETLVERWTTPDRFAVMITLCVLSMSDRKLYHDTVNHPEFRGLLETAPQLLDAFNGVLSADFASVGKGIAFAENMARSDRVMRKHADALAKQIRRNLVVQFVQPYKVLKLDAIATTFQMSRDGVERLLADLIARSSISARIDLDSGLLFASDNKADDIHAATIAAANDYVADMQQALRVQAMTMNKLFIPAKRKELGQGGGRGGGGGGDASVEGGVIGFEDYEDNFDDFSAGMPGMGFGGGGGGFGTMSRYGGGGGGRRLGGRR